MDANYKELEFLFASASIPSGAVAKVAVTALGKAIQEDGVTLSQTDSGLEISGMLESSPFLLQLDPEAGSPQKLLVPARELEIEFTNFRFLD